jgi:hypothetical protein
MCVRAPRGAADAGAAGLGLPAPRSAPPALLLLLLLLLQLRNVLPSGSRPMTAGMCAAT